jgi:Ketopantoate reductase PanE/ApbA C terminal
MLRGSLRRLFPRGKQPVHPISGNVQTDGNTGSSTVIPQCSDASARLTSGGNRCGTWYWALARFVVCLSKSFDKTLVMMWKIFFGFACNATIGSLTRSRAGVIARTVDGAAVVSAVIGECGKVVTALGYPPLPAFDSASIITGVFSQPNSTYGPSLLTDMEDGRPTEGEHTVGDLAERARQRGAALDCSSRLLSFGTLQKSKENSELSYNHVSARYLSQAIRYSTLTANWLSSWRQATPFQPCIHVDVGAC